MITFSSAQLDAWLAMLAFPFARIAGLVSVAPVFGGTGVPVRVRLMLGLAVTFALLPGLPPLPAISPGSWTGILVLAEQMLIGILIGFTLRIAFSTLDVAGELIGMQAGLSFAVSYDPQNAGQTSVIGDFLGLLATLIFLAINGHLLVLAALSESFHLLPIGATPAASSGLFSVVSWAAVLFSAGVLLSLPVVAALLIANIAMGILSRVAPQLNLFAVGFPVTIVSGFVVLTISLPYFGTAMEHLFDQAFTVLRGIVQATTGG